MEKYSKFLPFILRIQFFSFDIDKDSKEYKFLYKFEQNGGKYFLCSSFDSAVNKFKEVCKGERVFIGDEELLKKLEWYGLYFEGSINDSTSILTGCDFLVCSNGGVLFSSRQIGDRKLSDLPDNIVIFSKYSKIIDSVEEAMNLFNKMENRPTNITSIQNFGKAEGFVNLGSPYKNVFLLLLED